MAGSIHDEGDVERARKAARLDRYPLRRLRYAFYQLSRSPEEALDELPASAREIFSREVEFHALRLDQRVPAADGAVKLVFKTHEGRALESVILAPRANRRTTLCVSSQIGCAVNCSFCATGQMMRVTNLTASEILDQVVQANLLLRENGRKISNIVFMGMGEPLHNEDQVFHAAELLFSQFHFNLSPKRTTLSTVGIPDGMIRYAKRFPRASMALSLHATRQDLREKLIPLARRYPLLALRRALDEVLSLQQAPLMIEYLLLDQINDSPRDANDLVTFLQGLPVLVNLIPFNPVAHAPELRSSPREVGREFASRLRDAGFIVTFRHSLGRDVGAACGQLVQTLER